MKEFTYRRLVKVPTNQSHLVLGAGAARRASDLDGEGVGAVERRGRLFKELLMYVGVSKNRGGPPKWMVKIMENPN